VSFDDILDLWFFNFQEKHKNLALAAFLSGKKEITKIAHARLTRMSCPIASLPSLLFLSPASSSRLMTLGFVTASALDDFSTCILSSTHVLSPHPSIVNSVFSKINLLAIAHSHFMLRQAIKGQTYKGITVNMTDMPKKKTSLNIEEDTWKQWLLFVIQKHGSSRRVSEETARAVKEYMKKHGDERIDDKGD
jgi:hypothetical protein